MTSEGTIRAIQGLDARVLALMTKDAATPAVDV